MDIYRDQIESRVFLDGIITLADLFGCETEDMLEDYPALHKMDFISHDGLLSETEKKEMLDLFEKLYKTLNDSLWLAMKEETPAKILEKYMEIGHGDLLRLPIFPNNESLRYAVIKLLWTAIRACSDIADELGMRWPQPIFHPHVFGRWHPQNILDERLSRIETALLQANMIAFQKEWEEDEDREKEIMQKTLQTKCSLDDFPS